MASEVKYVAVPCDAELFAALEASCRKSGRKLGPEVAFRLRRSFKIGPFVQKKEVA